MEYKEIDFLCGWTIERAVKELHERAKDGNKYCGKFNGNKLTSDMSLDEAYMLCIGKTFEQFNKVPQEVLFMTVYLRKRVYFFQVRIFGLTAFLCNIKCVILVRNFFQTHKFLPMTS